MTESRKKIIQRSQPAFSDLELNNLTLHPVLKRVLVTRGVTNEVELDKSLTHLLKPEALKGLPVAVELLVSAIQQQKKILILGDFDADGATSTALVIRALNAMGHDLVDFIVPNRFEYGYGLSAEIVPLIAEKNPDLLITVDNGISSIEGVALAKSLGWQVIITDHHLAGSKLPLADAIVNPNQPGCHFESKHLAGVGVIFYVMVGLRAALKDLGWFKEKNLEVPNMGAFLDLVALGTVADVVPLDRNNRLMVAAGLERIRRGKTSPGIKALCEVSKRPIMHLQAADLGYALGPRLNAAGRLDDMASGIRGLVTDDAWEAKTVAIELNSLNALRREIETDMKIQAEACLAALGEKESLPLGLALYEQEWHQGVVGILASRIKDKFHRPVFAFAQVDETELKGSGRSISGIHLRDVLDAIATRYPGIIHKFGGHAMAAGLTIPIEQFENFSRAFDEEIKRCIQPEMLDACLLTDGELSAEELTIELAELFREAGPWGQSFPEPTFDGSFEVIHKRVLGDKHLKLALSPPSGKPVVDAIAFNVEPNLLAYDWQRIRLVYKLDVNRFSGKPALQLMVNYIEPPLPYAEEARTEPETLQTSLETLC